MSCGHWMFLPLPTSLLTSLWNLLVNYCLISHNGISWLMVSSSLTSLCLVAMYCPNLEKLDISGVSVTQTSFKQFSTSCPKLKVCLTELSRQQYKSNVSSLFSVAKSVWSTLHWREMVTKANITASLCDPSVIMLWWCHCMYVYVSLWWAMHNCTELEHVDLSKNKRISGQVRSLSDTMKLLTFIPHVWIICLPSVSMWLEVGFILFCYLSHLWLRPGSSCWLSTPHSSGVWTSVVVISWAVVLCAALLR